MQCACSAHAVRMQWCACSARAVRVQCACSARAVRVRRHLVQSDARLALDLEHRADAAVLHAVDLAEAEVRRRVRRARQRMEHRPHAPARATVRLVEEDGPVDVRAVGTAARAAGALRPHHRAQHLVVGEGLHLELAVRLGVAVEEEADQEDEAEHEAAAHGRAAPPEALLVVLVRCRLGRPPLSCCALPHLLDRRHKCFADVFAGM